jgi:signal transduction histidine kinase
MLIHSMTLFVHYFINCSCLKPQQWPIDAIFNKSLNDSFRLFLPLDFLQNYGRNQSLHFAIFEVDIYGFILFWFSNLCAKNSVFCKLWTNLKKRNEKKYKP